jgi:hypothetical protein
MTDGNWHPSVAKFVNGMPDRGPMSPWAYVEYEVDNHTHLVPMGDGVGAALLGIEEGADDLAEAVMRCGEDRHDGHGRQHPSDAPEKAYRAAISQLMTKEYDREHWHEEWLKAMHKKWGGHIPGAVFLPNEENPSEWSLMAPDEKGDPVFFEVPKGAVDDMMRPPDKSNSVKAEFGWQTKRRWPAQRRLRHIQGRK